MHCLVLHELVCVLGACKDKMLMRDDSTHPQLSCFSLRHHSLPAPAPRSTPHTPLSEELTLATLDLSALLTDAQQQQHQPVEDGSQSMNPSSSRDLLCLPPFAVSDITVVASAAGIANALHMWPKLVFQGGEGAPALSYCTRTGQMKQGTCGCEEGSGLVF